MDEGVEVAVKHALGVPHLEVRPLVLHLLVGVEDVAADRLAAEAAVLNVSALLAVCLFAACER